MTEDEKNTVKELIKLFDELLIRYRDIKLKYIFETSTDDESDEKELSGELNGLSEKKDLILRNNVL